MTGALADGTPPVWCVGLMTGTALDGEIDLAALRTDGRTVAEIGPAGAAPYDPAVMDLLRAAQAAARDWGFDGPEPAVFAEAEAALTAAQADAVTAFARAHGLSPALIGFHGQTVLHRPAAPGRPGATRQLGDGALMAARTGIETIFDFRSADVAAGGQGAPLAPAYHAALLGRLGAGAETAMLNLGGVGNLTWTDGAAVVGFDTGPANAPLDDLARRVTGAAMDRDGALAAAGRVDEARLAGWLRHPFFARPYPKSLDRDDFGVGLAAGLAPPDAAATLTALAAAAVGRALDLLPARPRRVVVCGGGRRNPALMRALADRAGAEPVDADALGLRGDAVEAECFAFLAARSARGLPISFPATTGAPAPLTGGRRAVPPA